MTNVPDYYVGIGASAGGLEALEQFFRKLPSSTGMAYVVVQHLSPDFKSIMDELLGRYTKMSVLLAEDGMKVEADHVYLIPPKKKLAIFHGKLVVENQGQRTHLNLPIDLFFKSLALDQDKKAIAVVLSGTGSDGTQGIRAIKSSGGLVFVQDETTAKFDGMPKSAIATGLCDYRLAPAAIADELVALSQFTKTGEVTEEVPKDALLKISELMRRHGGLDFSSYKESTLWRRVDRRMKMNRVENVENYLQLLQSSEAERMTLQQEFLIGVTSFFRDEDAFASLQSRVLPELEYTKGQIRIWSAGCSTGEEVYSLAILFKEYMRANHLECEIKIFATDVDERALEFAGNGFYSEGIAAYMNPTLLATYFDKLEDGYKVKEFIRKMIVFAKHNMLKDPPFSKLDLIVCRNVFIYLNNPYQQGVLHQFYYSLAPNGFLFMGSSESLGEMSSAFQVIDGKWKIYRYREGYQGSPTSSVFYSSHRLQRTRPNELVETSRMTPSIKIESLLDKAISTISPPAILVDSKDMIVHTINDVSDFVRIQPGRFSNLLLNNMRKEMALLISNMTRKAKNQPEELQVMKMTHPEKEDQDIVVHVKALDVANQLFYLISFHEVQERVEISPVVSIDLTNEMKIHVQDLEQELKLAREGLQASVEELETSNEELQSSNEELIASNEELQSTNEELQSVNEELYTVNTEHQSKIGELTKLTNDLNNLLRNAEVGAIYLDRQLLIRKITPLIAKITSVLESDISRPIYHLKLMESYPELMDDIYAVQEELVPIEREVHVESGKWYLVRIRPYRTEFNSVEGIMITFIEITGLKQQQFLTEQSNRRLELALKMGKMAWWEYDIEKEKIEYSETLAHLLGYSPSELPTTLNEFSKWIHVEEREKVVAAIRDLVEGSNDLWDFKYRMQQKTGSYILFHDRGQVMEHTADGKPRTIVGTVIDITNYQEGM